MQPAWGASSSSSSSSSSVDGARLPPRLPPRSSPHTHADKPPLGPHCRGDALCRRSHFVTVPRYIYRVNDDTQMANPWAGALVGALGALGAPYGAAGPACRQGKKSIMTHDFTHHTHMEIFNGSYYPPALSDWSALSSVETVRVRGLGWSATRASATNGEARERGARATHVAAGCRHTRRAPWANGARARTAEPLRDAPSSPSPNGRCDHDDTPRAPGRYMDDWISRVYGTRRTVRAPQGVEVGVANHVLVFVCGVARRSVDERTARVVRPCCASQERACAHAHTHTRAGKTPHLSARARPRTCGHNMHVRTSHCAVPSSAAASL